MFSQRLSRRQFVAEAAYVTSCCTHCASLRASATMFVPCCDVVTVPSENNDTYRTGRSSQNLGSRPSDFCAAGGIDPPSFAVGTFLASAKPLPPCQRYCTVVIPYIRDVPFPTQHGWDLSSEEAVCDNPEESPSRHRSHNSPSIERHRVSWILNIWKKVLCKRSDEEKQERPEMSTLAGTLLRATCSS